MPSERGDDDAGVLERLAQGLQHPLGELGQLVEKELGGQSRDHGFQVGSLEEALPGVVLGQHPDLRDGRRAGL
jgi:hypothetical protein